MNKVQQGMFSLAAKIVAEAMASGLSWDESVAALGVAAGVLARCASNNGDGPIVDCQAHAQKRFAEGIAQPVNVVFAAADPTQLQRAHYADPDVAEAILGNVNQRVILKLH